MSDNADYRAINRQLKADIDFHIIGNHMQVVRKARGMTQAAVAEKMKLGTKYYAAMEAGAVKISFSRFLQFIIIMQTSADYLLSGCQPNYPTQFSCPTDACKERVLLNRLLDQCSDDLTKTLYVIAQGLIVNKN